MINSQNQQFLLLSNSACYNRVIDWCFVLIFICISMFFRTHFNLNFLSSLPKFVGWIDFQDPFFFFSFETDSFWNGNFNKLLILLCDQINFRKDSWLRFPLSVLLSVFPLKPSIVKIAYSNIYCRCHKLHKEKALYPLKAVFPIFFSISKLGRP